MFFCLLALLTIPGVTRGNYFTSPLLNVLRRRLCDSVQLEGLISDCSCNFGSVDKSVTQFFLPILKDITSRTFFRYFRVNLDGKCPFWQEDGQCMMESCSVCTCEDNEVPRSWVDDHDRRNAGYGMNDKSFDVDGFGWISSAPSSAGTSVTNHNDDFGRLNMSVSIRKVTDSFRNGEPYLQYLRDTEDDGKNSYIFNLLRSVSYTSYASNLHQTTIGRTCLKLLSSQNHFHTMYTTGKSPL